MKIKAKALQISIIITALSLLISILIQSCPNLNKETKNFTLDVLIGIFTGAFLSVIIFSVEYLEEKRSTLLKYYLLSLEHLNNFYNINYIFLSKPGIYPDEFRKDINNFIDDIIKISKLRYQDITDYYISIQYLWFNKKLKKDIFDRIHKPQQEMLDFINGHTSALLLYKNGDITNQRAIIDKICELQNKIFEVKYEVCDGMENIKVYNAYYNKIDKELELFRSKIYGLKPETQDIRLINVRSFDIGECINEYCQILKQPKN